MYYIVKCSTCGTVQYILKEQKTRTCPRCKTRLVCKNLKIFDKAQSVQEASQIVRSMKSPAEINQRVARLRANQSTSKGDRNQMLGNLISELLAIFPNAMPKKILLEKGIELDLTSEFIEQFLEKLHEEGLMIINKDYTNKQGQEILKFPSLPFKFGKVWVNKPLSASQIRKKKWN